MTRTIDDEGYKPRTQPHTHEQPTPARTCCVSNFLAITRRLRGQHLRGHEVDLRVEGGLDAALDSQHLPHRLLVAVLDLEVLPRLPELLRRLHDRHVNARYMNIKNTLGY